MALNTFDLTHTDLSKFLWRGETPDWPANDQADVADWILIHSVRVNKELRRHGFDPAVITNDSDQSLYVFSRAVILLLVASDFQEGQLQEVSFLAQKRRARADEMLDDFAMNPESYAESWVRTKHRGSWGYETDQTGDLDNPLRVNWRSLRGG